MTGGRQGWRRWLGLALCTGVVMGAASARAAADDLREHLGRHRAILEELETRAAEDSLAEFMRQAWHIVEPVTPLVWNWHLDAKCEHLEAVTEGHLHYLIINEPPRHTKSITVNVMWPAWEWIRLPHLRTLSISGVSNLAMRDAVNTRTILQSEWFRRRWGHKFRLVGDQNVKTYYVNDRRGSRRASSFDSNIVGEGGDRLSIDDPIDLKDAENPAELQRINGIWDRSLMSRVNDPKRSAKIITMQRVADNDLCGHVRDQHDWTWLRLPAVMDAKIRCRTFYFRDDVIYRRNAKTQRRERVVVGKRKVRFEDTRKEGELLNEARGFDKAAIATARKQGSSTFNAQQQQNPTPRQGTIIKRHWFRYYSAETPHPLPRVAITDVVISVDTALKAKQRNDPWSIAAWGRAGGNFFLLKAEHGKMQYSDGLRHIHDLHRWARETYKRAGIHVLVENTASGPEVIADLRDTISGVIPETPDADKERRLRIASPAFESGSVWVPGAALADGSDYDPARTPAWVQEFVDEVVGFPTVTHDDRVDTATQAIRRFQRQAATKGADSVSAGGPTSRTVF